MKTFLAIVSLLAIVLAVPAMAARKGKAPNATPAAENRIVEVNPVSITVSIGESGNEHFTYKITDSTKVTLNGLPVAARELRPGMVARLSLSPDRTTVQAIDAQDPPAHLGRHRVG